MSARRQRVAEVVVLLADRVEPTYRLGRSNLGYGVYARGACSGTVLQRSTIIANAQGNLNLSRSRGITDLP
jgi:hypothetical protein